MIKNHMEFHYFHEYEANQFAFYRIPKALFTEDCFRSLSSDAKVLYGLMLDRMSLSVKNNWIDEEGRVYIIFTLEHVMQYMNCGKDKGVKILAELDTEKGIGLIERIRRGLGKPTIIYIKNFVLREKSEIQEPLHYEEETENAEEQSAEAQSAEVLTSEKPKSGVLKNRSLDFGKTDSNYNNYNKTDLNNSNLIHLSGNHNIPGG